MALQKTLKSAASCTGVGLHSGRDITMVLHPAEAGSGIVFVRTDITQGDNVIPARWDMVVDTQLCTVIANANGAKVGTIEHVMSALRGLGVDNARIEIDGAEVPVMDGSAMPFIKVIEEAGLKTQGAPRRVIKVLKEVSVELNGKRASLSPSDASIFGGEVDFDHPSIGRQHFETQLIYGNLKHDIAQARTFGLLHEVEWMRSQGLAQGGSLENAIVLDEKTVMNTEGLRYRDEFIRHKLLDAIGDLYLAGGQIIGSYNGYKAGHDLNNRLLRALFAQKDAWEIVDMDDLPAAPVFSASSPEALHGANA